MLSSGVISHHPPWTSIIYLHTVALAWRLRNAFTWMNLLGGRVRDELDTLADVTLQTIVAGLEKLLLVLVCTADDVDGLLGTVGLS